MPDRRSHLDPAATLVLVGCCALWGLNQVAVKLAMPEIPPLMQASIRGLGAALLVLLWAAWRGIGLLGRDGSLRGGLLAGVLFALEFGCIFLGLQYTSASRMVVFIYLAPFVVALGMPFIARHERLSLPALGGLLLAFFGVAWAFAEGFQRPQVGPLQWLGDALGIAGGVFWGLTTLAIRGTALSSAPPEKTLLYQLGISGVLLGIAALAVGTSPRWPLSTLAIGSMAFQTVVVTFASYLAWFGLVRRYAATRLAAFTLTTPIFGLLFGAWLLDEPITARLVLALVAVTVGIAIVNRAPAAAPAASRPAATGR